MRLPTLFFLIASFVFIVFWGAEATAPASGGVSETPAASPAASRAATAPRVVETERVRAHLRDVEETLRAADVSHLSPDQRAARSRILDRLAEYRAAGVFPHNHTHPDEQLPVFVDEHDTPCAVGHLLLRSGELNLVRDVVEGDNNVRIHDLSDDPRLREWLEAQGLSLDEAARIQPAYNGCGIMGDCPPEPEPSPGGSLERYNPTTVGLAGLTAGAMTWGLMADRTSDGFDWPAWVAIGAGVVDGVHAARGMDASQDGWAIGVSLAAGFGGALVGLHRLRARDRAPGPLERSSVQVTPLVSRDRAGLALRWNH